MKEIINKAIIDEIFNVCEHTVENQETFLAFPDDLGPSDYINIPIDLQFKNEQELTDAHFRAIIGAAISRNIVVYNEIFNTISSEFVSLLKLYIRRNRPTHPSSISRGKLTHLIIDESNRNITGCSLIKDIYSGEILFGDLSRYAASFEELAGLNYKNAIIAVDVSYNSFLSIKSSIGYGIAILDDYSVLLGKLNLS